jgi:hypothetical protein
MVTSSDGPIRPLILHVQAIYYGVHAPRCTSAASLWPYLDAPGSGLGAKGQATLAGSTVRRRRCLYHRPYVWLGPPIWGRMVEEVGAVYCVLYCPHLEPCPELLQLRTAHVEGSNRGEAVQRTTMAGAGTKPDKRRARTERRRPHMARRGSLSQLNGPPA